MIRRVIGSITGSPEMFIETNTLIFDFTLAKQPSRLNLAQFPEISSRAWINMSSRRRKILAQYSSQIQIRPNPIHQCLCDLNLTFADSDSCLLNATSCFSHYLSLWFHHYGTCLVTHRLLCTHRPATGRFWSSKPPESPPSSHSSMLLFSLFQHRRKRWHTLSSALCLCRKFFPLKHHVEKPFVPFFLHSKPKSLQGRP